MFRPGFTLCRINAGPTACIATRAHSRRKDRPTPALLIFPALFLFSEPIVETLFPAQYRPIGAGSTTIRKVPVVMVLFDELNVTSLMDAERRVDPALYPNLAWLAERAYWFRNATGVADGTVHAVPAVLAGLYAGNRQPTYQGYPNSLFTLLAPTHVLNVHESSSRLCPETLCTDLRKRPGYARRIAALATDVATVYGHIVLPDSYAAALPDITQGWGNFLGTGEQSRDKSAGPFDGLPWMQFVTHNMLLDRPALFRRFIETIPPSTTPSFNLLHILFPHVPLQYLPSGKDYGRQEIPGLDKEKWSNDQWAVWQGWQRHLLQVAYTDRLLGELFASLRARGLFDPALIVITADHGVSFKTDDWRRPVSETNYMDILPVPLFIKLPGQTGGIVSDRNAETVDILPTIADVLGIELPAPVEGISVFDGPRIAARAEKQLFTYRFGGKRYTYSATLEEKYATLAERLHLFDAGDDSDKLFAIGPDKALIGRNAHVLASGDASTLRIEVDGHVTDSPFKKGTGPNYVKGTIFSANPGSQPIRLALSVNGIVSAVTQTFNQYHGNNPWFAFLVPESAYRDVANRIEIFVIQGAAPAQISLARLKGQAPVTFSLISENGRLSALSSTMGARIPIIPGAIRGYLDLLNLKDGRLHAAGWAADMKKGKPAKVVVLFIDGKFVASGSPRIPREGVARVLKNEGFLESGFSFSAPFKLRRNLSARNIILFGISENGEASPLIIPEKVVPP